MAVATGKFDFLGFTHLWGRSRRGTAGGPAVHGQEPGLQSCRAGRSWDWCKRNRHLPIAEQHGHLASVVRGHCGYYGLTGNGKRLANFRLAVVNAWRRWLGQRHRGAGLSWDRFKAILALLPLPQAKVVHSIYAT